MILITVGTEKFPFNRLMTWIDRLIEQQFINPNEEEIIVQYGSCTIQPQGVKAYQVLPSQDFQALVAEARLIIAHCGEGSIDLLAKAGKPYILVPRSGQFGEHVDDHQVELARSLARQQVPIAYTPGDLVRFLQAPVFVEIPATPTQYYAQASQLLHQDLVTLTTPKTRSSRALLPGLASLANIGNWVARVPAVFSQITA
ncbi:glycosyltransferase [Synechocystis sp. LKSZ1]|uniref:glycosyltransferase n=1 Tax=Synechocystis sp. LKSZ1 TaxID=3144951 RepID=UPI00336BE4CB